MVSWGFTGPALLLLRLWKSTKRGLLITESRDTIDTRQTAQSDSCTFGAFWTKFQLFKTSEKYFLKGVLLEILVLKKVIFVGD